jgi:hypothetical protein
MSDAPLAHSKFSASNFEADTLCPGRRTMQAGLPDRGSKYADEGTAAHALFGDMIEGNPTQAAYVVNGTSWPVTPDMLTAVSAAVKARTVNAVVLSEQRVNYSGFLGVPTDDAWGTSDIIAAEGSELQVDDYKHGMGVEVFAEHNPQMMLYALGALEAVDDLLGPFETVRMTIHQPRIKRAPDEWVTTVAELKAWAAGEAHRAVGEQLNAQYLYRNPTYPLSETEWEQKYLRPNDKSCKFCKAKSTCPALRNEAALTVFESSPASPDEFDGLAMAETPKQSDVAWLAKVLSKADLIEGYLKAVRAEVEARLLEGIDVPGFKLVRGKQGNRAWGNAAEAEAALKAMRLKVEEMYDLKLISPTTAEKLAKAKTIGPRQWKTLQEGITRFEVAMHVTPDSDPRLALVLTKVADEFDIVSTDTVSSTDLA